MHYERFSPPRRVAEYAGIAGAELGGMALPAWAYDALSESKTTGQPCELVVIGALHHDDGTRFLSFGVPRDHIERTTDYRWDEDAHRLRLVCPLCDMKDGRHTKSCDRR